MLDLQHKMRVLGTRMDCELFFRLQRLLEDQLAESQLPIPQAVLQGLMVELCYLIVTYRPWLNQQRFHELAAAFLEADYGLKWSVAESILLHLRAFGQHDSVTAGDSETSELQLVQSHAASEQFMRFVLVRMLRSRHDENLAADIGFGTTVLQALRSLVEDQVIGKSYVEFPVHLQEEILAVVATIAAGMDEKSWFLDLEDLRFRMEDLPKEDPIRAFYQKAGEDLFLQYLCSLGFARKVTRKELLATFAGWQLKGTSLLAGFVHRGFLMPSGRHLVPAALTFELTAGLAAMKWMEKGTPSGSEFVKLPEAYQAGLVRRWGAGQSEIPADVLQAIRLWCPRAIRELRSFCSFSATLDLEEVLSKLGASQDPLRRSAGVWVATGLDHDWVRPFLEKTLQGDGSAAVRRAAMVALEQYHRPSGIEIAS